MTLTTFESGSPTNPTIVFLHGLGVSSWMWHDQIEALKAAYHCVAVDLPGSGESYQVEWHSLTETAVQLASLIRQKASGGQAHVVGLSLGGYTALRLLADHADVVRSTFVSGVTTRPFPAPYKLLVAVVSRTIRWDWMITLNAKLMQFPPEVIPLYRRDSKRLSQQTIHRIYDEVLSFTLPPALTQRPQRLLAAAGEKETKLVRDSLADFTAVPHARTALIPNAHHGWTGEHPQLFTQTVRDWVAERPLAMETKMA